MYQHEAAEKAGDEGRIRRRCWGKSRYIYITDGMLYEASLKNLTADDWEVVQDGIEVGDVVTACCDAEECRVVGVHYNGDRCAVQSIRRPWCVCCVCDEYDNERPLSIKTDLSLIRKGPRW